MKKKMKIGRSLKKSPIEITLVLAAAVGIAFTAIPASVAEESVQDLAYLKENIDLQVKKMQNSHVPFGSLPVAEDRAPIPLMRVAVSAYNSVPWQTDDTPCIGAQGTDICVLLDQGLNTCAANFLPLGTMLEVDGLGTCEVRDRMNARYHYRVDWYMGMDIASARQFGVQNKQIALYAS